MARLWRRAGQGGRAGFSRALCTRGTSYAPPTVCDRTDAPPVDYDGALAATRDKTARVIQEVGEKGWCVAPGFLPPALVAAMRADALSLWSRGLFKPAGVGQGTSQQLRPQLRSDQVLWLGEQEEERGKAEGGAERRGDSDSREGGGGGLTIASSGGGNGGGSVALPASIRLYYDVLREMRAQMNREFFTSMKRFEGHLAIYSPGSRYGRHVDQFVGSRHRIMSCILYLNPHDWALEDGGQLRMYLGPEDCTLPPEARPAGPNSSDVVVVQPTARRGTGREQDGGGAWRAAAASAEASGVDYLRSDGHGNSSSSGGGHSSASSSASQAAAARAPPPGVLDVVPHGGTFVCFRSELVPHEVLASRRHRLSLTGWMRDDL